MDGSARRAAPVPPIRRVVAEVAEDPAAMLGRHPADELVRELLHDLGREAEPLQPGAREGEVECLALRPLVACGDRARDLAEPASCGGGVLEPEQDETGRIQISVAAGHEPLHVGEVERRRYRACSHRRASSPPMSP